MQQSSKSEANRNREEHQPSQNVSGLRQAQGYITLSPARKGKDRNKSQRNSDPFEIENERSVSQQLNPRPNSQISMKENENSDNLPIRTEQYFKKIPKYSLQEVSIRQAFTEGAFQSQSSKKKKLSVTKLFQNIELSNRSQDGGSVHASYRVKDFEGER